MKTALHYNTLCIKKKKYIFLVVTLCFLMLYSHSFAQQNPNIISYEQYIAVISEKLPQIKNNALQVQKAQNQVEKAKSISDTSVVANGYYARQKQYTTGKNLFEPDYNNTYYGYAGIEQIIPATGTRISAGAEYESTFVKGTVTLPVTQAMSVDAYRPSVKASITQPLLKNAFGFVDKYEKNSALKKLDIQKLQKLTDDQSVLNYYKKLFFKWILYQQALEILKESMDNAQSLVDSVQRKAKSGLAENDDVQRAYSSLLNYQAQYTQYEITYKSLCDELSLYFDKPVAPYTDDLQHIFASVAQNEFAEVEFEKTRAYLIVAKNIDAVTYAINVASNSTLPEMNLMVSVARKNYSNIKSEALSKLPDTDYSLGFEFRYPLGNHGADAQLYEYELSLMELQHNLLIAKNNYYTSLRALIQSLNGYKSIIDTHNKNLQALLSQRQTERKKYEQARLDLQYLINTENNIAMEKLAILQFQVTLIGCYIDYSDMIQ